MTVTFRPIRCRCRALERPTKPPPTIIEWRPVWDVRERRNCVRNDEQPSAETWRNAEVEPVALLETHADAHCKDIDFMV